MSKLLVIKQQWCKSCGYCVKQCPKAALSLGKDLNEAGYSYVVLDQEKCIVCGQCYSVCPDYVFSIAEN